MKAEEAYAIWAPSESPWSPWVKPILFANAHEWDLPDQEQLAASAEPSWLPARDTSTAFVIDLPGAEGVQFGLALARRGWSLVPLYNSVPGRLISVGAPDDVGLVDVWSIIAAMRRATAILRELASAPDGPPAFLLDAHRRFGSGIPAPGKFDNRSISLPTDFPSGVFLHSRGIRRVILVQREGERPQEDLAHTLRAWQQAGLSIEVAASSSGQPPAPVQVAQPSHFRALWYRFLAMLSMRRNPLGGFGGTIPVPSAG